MQSQAFCQSPSCDVSVVIPTYNRKSLLLRAIDSVIGHNDADFEIIVVDDGSTDGTEEAIRGLGQPKVRYFKQENSGACVARNRGVAEARGVYVAFLDSDDVWRKNKLDIQLKQIAECGGDMVFCAFCRHGCSDGKTETFPGHRARPGLIPYEQLLPENLIGTPTILGKRECFLRHPFNPDFPRLQDWEMVLRISQDSAIYYFDTVLVDAYEQEGGISQGAEKAMRALKMLYQQHKAAYRGSDRLMKCMMNSMVLAANRCGYNLWREYLAAVSLRFPPKSNYQYLRSGMKCLIVGLARGGNARARARIGM